MSRFKSKHNALLWSVVGFIAAMAHAYPSPAVGIRENPFKSRQNLLSPGAIVIEPLTAPFGSIAWRSLQNNRCRSMLTRGPDGSIYIGCRDNNLYAVSRKGTQRWSVGAKRDVDSKPTLGPNGNVFFGSDDGFFYGVSSKGKTLWKYSTGSVIQSSPAVTLSGRIYVGSRSNHLYALSPTGQVIWKYKTDGNVDGSPIVGPDSTVYISSEPGRLYAIRPDGVLKWKRSFQGDPKGRPILTPESIICLVSGNRNLYCFEKSGGKLLWKRQFSSHISSNIVLTPEGRILIYSEDRGLIAFNAQSVEVSNVVFPDTGKGHVSLGYNSRYVVTRDKGEVFVLDEYFRPLWRAPTRLIGNPVAPAVMDVNGSVWVSSNKGLFRLSPPL